MLTGVITKHIPEAAEHMSAGLRGQEKVTPRQISGMLPRPDGVLADLERGFAAVSAGEPIPLEVITAPQPTETRMPTSREGRAAERPRLLVHARRRRHPRRSSWSTARTASAGRTAPPTTSDSTRACPRRASRPVWRWARAGTPTSSARSVSRSARRLALSMSTSSSDRRSTSNARRWAAARSSTSPRTRCSPASSPPPTCRACRAPESAPRSSTSR